MQHAARSFPGQLSVAQQSLGRGCLLIACATQTLPTRGTVEGVKKNKNKSEYNHKRQCVFHLLAGRNYEQTKKD